jgi:hypothetical protein
LHTFGIALKRGEVQWLHTSIGNSFFVTDAMQGPTWRHASGT